MGDGKAEISAAVAINSDLIGATSAILFRLAVRTFARLAFHGYRCAWHNRTRGVFDCARDGNPVLALGRRNQGSVALLSVTRTSGVRKAKG